MCLPHHPPLGLAKLGTKQEEVRKLDVALSFLGNHFRAITGWGGGGGN